MTPETGTLLSLGHGYSARALVKLLGPGWRVVGTTRTEEKVNIFKDEGVEPIIFPGNDLKPALAEATHILASAAPLESGDPFLEEIAEALPLSRAVWVGYLSTTGVYGDHQGGWVDEASPLSPATPRGRLRVMAERQWQVACRNAGLPLHIFRLAGIYGPGRGPFEKVRAGTARRIIKTGQVFSRIHVEDIAQVLQASIAAPNNDRRTAAIYNVCDNDPAPPQDVLAHAAELLGLPPPPEVPFELAAMSPMARSFYAESKRVRNDRIKDELGVSLLYPSYRDGLPALMAE
ncbi:MAG: SDR family oxidoreductase [Pseudomonadota bacterium]